VNTPLPAEELLALYDLPPHSAEAQMIIVAARELGFRLSEGQAQIYAQIGVDGRPCAEDCLYCSYASVNCGSYEGPAELPPEEVIGYAQAFDDAGVHLISLMTTTAYRFGEFCELASAVRAAVKSDMVLLANIGDISLSQAHTLRELGVDALYHAVRLGEGRITGIDPERRRASIAAARQAGLRLMSGIEPLYEGQQAAEVVERIYETNTFEPLCSGLCSLHAVKGTKMEDYVPISLERRRYLAALARLASGPATRFGFVGNTVWIDAGADPRGREFPTSHEVLARKVTSARESLESLGWQVACRPLSIWKGQ
jgi:biotin synthase